MYSRAPSRLPWALVLVVCLAAPARGEFQEVNPPSPRGEGDPLGQPPGFPVPPGRPPGFTEEGEDEEGQPEASQTGAVLADAAYVAAGLLALLSARKLPAGVMRALEGGGNLWNLRLRREEYEALRRAIEAAEREHPRVMADIRAAYGRYRREMEALSRHLDAMPGGASGTYAAKLADVDRATAAIRELPLVRRRPALRRELEPLIQAWLRDRDPGPLAEWVRTHGDYDVIRTGNGRQWLGRFHEAHRELALLAWRERGSLAPLERFLGWSPAGLEVWATAYRGLRDKEGQASAVFAREANASLRSFFTSETAPHLHLALPEGGVREPGQFLLLGAPPNGEISWRGLPGALEQPCAAWLANLRSLGAAARGRQSVGGQALRLAWPLVPAAAGTGVGGYFGLEGLRHWLFPDAGD